MCFMIAFKFPTDALPLNHSQSSQDLKKKKKTYFSFISSKIKKKSLELKSFKTLLCVKYTIKNYKRAKFNFNIPRISK